MIIWKAFFFLLLLEFFVFLFFEMRKLNEINKGHITEIKSKKIDIFNNKCYSPLLKIRIIHFIITRFLTKFSSNNEIKKLLLTEKYIKNGIRVMEKYLFPSLENQSCKNFTWILMVGDKANKTYVETLLNLKANSFESKVLYKKDIKNYVRNRSKGFDVLITTRIDYDDIIYYDAVNDVRKAINIHKPFLLYGYNRGIIYFELDGKYYDFYSMSNRGCLAIFTSLIVFLNRVNDSYTIYDIGDHTKIRSQILKNFKFYGIKSLNYEPAIFDTGGPKFAYIRQKYSNTYNLSQKVRKRKELVNLNLNQFFNFVIK